MHAIDCDLEDQSSCYQSYSTVSYLDAGKGLSHALPLESVQGSERVRPGENRDK